MRDKFFKYVFVANIIFFLVGFFLGNPIKRFDKYTTFEGLKGIVTAQLAKNASVKNEAQKSSAQTKIPQLLPRPESLEEAIPEQLDLLSGRELWKFLGKIQFLEQGLRHMHMHIIK